MEGNLAILEGNFDWVPGKKGIFSSRDNAHPRGLGINPGTSHMVGNSQ